MTANRLLASINNDRETAIDGSIPQFTVGEGTKRMVFSRAFSVANTVYSNFGYAIIKLSPRDGYVVGLAEIGNSGMWLI